MVARVVSKFRGVTWDDATAKWQASAFDGSSHVSLGLFDTQVRRDEEGFRVRRVEEGEVAWGEGRGVGTQVRRDEEGGGAWS
eukprot:112553-Chlamydomonas_euryale.AAC.1